jgi:phosphoribosylglycinamide formyltransferase-1
MINIGVLVSGRGTNLQTIIEAIEEGKIEGKIKVVISDNLDAYALKRAEQHNIETQYINHKEFKNREDYDKKIVETLENKEVELVVLAGYMRILSSYFIKAYKYSSCTTPFFSWPASPETSGRIWSKNFWLYGAFCR